MNEMLKTLARREREIVRLYLHQRLGDSVFPDVLHQLDFLSSEWPDSSYEWLKNKLNKALQGEKYSNDCSSARGSLEWLYHYYNQKESICPTCGVDVTQTTFGYCEHTRQQVIDKLKKTVPHSYDRRF